MAENSPQQPKRRRGPGRPFKPGQSGNPGGRPKGVVAKAKAIIGEDGGDMLAILDGIARGTLILKSYTAAGEEFDAEPSFRERREAAVELLNRAFGRPTDSLELSGRDGGPICAVFRIEEG